MEIGKLFIALVEKSNRLGFAVLLSLTLGLVPCLPEPHILGKLKWLFGGGGMHVMDFFDFVLHGLPWVYLTME